MAPFFKRSRKAVITASALLSLSAATTVSAKDVHRYHDYARVLSAVPHYRYVEVREPQRVCTPVQRRHHHGSHRGHGNHYDPNHHYRSTRHHRDPDPAAVIVGGVIGGAIGHHVTRAINGNASRGATLAGAAIGATLGASSGNYRKHYDNTRYVHREHGHGGQKHRRQEQRCTTTTQVRREKKHDGYTVTYAYRGHEFQTFTRHHPGKRIRVKIALSAAID